MIIVSKFARWLSDSVGPRLRAKRIGPLLKMIEATFRQYGFVTIVDIGGTEQYWGIVSQQYLNQFKVNITIVNLPGNSTPKDHGPFKFVQADGCDLSYFANKSFHIAHSNSVVEHVGDWGRMVQFATELSRVAEQFFVQTPNYWFPIEPHSMTPFFHWLPKPLRIWLVLHFQLGGYWKKARSVDEAVRIVESSRLLDRRMLKELFKDGRVLNERYLGLVKSFICIRS